MRNPNVSHFPSPPLSSSEELSWCFEKAMAMFFQEATMKNGEATKSETRQLVQWFQSISMSMGKFKDQRERHGEHAVKQLDITLRNLWTLAMDMLNKKELGPVRV